MTKKSKTEEKISTDKRERTSSKVLGLDISTSCIGASVVIDDGWHEPIVEWVTHITPKIPKKMEGIEALIHRKDIFENDFLSKLKDMGITDCVIESPILHSMSGHSTAQTIAQLIKFNALLSEAVYRVLGIIPHYFSSYEARLLSFPQLMSLRKFNKKGETYPLKHFEAAIKKNHLIPFGSYPFDCDKKSIMMDLVCGRFPDIDWVRDKNGNIIKENYDACDSLVCALAYINYKRYGDMDAKIFYHSIVIDEDKTTLSYSIQIWDKQYDKKIVIEKPKEEPEDEKKEEIEDVKKEEE